MGILLAYMLSSAICLGVLLSVYKITLSGKKQPAFNRVILLGILAGSFMLPLVWSSCSFESDAYPVTYHDNGESSQTEVFYDGMTAMSASSDIMPDYETAETDEVTYEDAGQTATVVPVARTADFVSSPQSEHKRAGSISPVWVRVLVAVWLLGSVCVFLMTMMSLVKGLCRLAGGVRMNVNGVRCVIVDDEKNTPCAFFGHIFLSRRDLAGKSDMVVLHEVSHLRHHHGIDLLLARIVAIMEWWNPFAWVMLVELHAVHEYQADCDVLADHDVDETSYQYMLVERAARNSGISLTNGFAQNRLEKRILMMKRPFSGSEGRIRAAWLIPGCILAVAVLAMPVVGEASNSLIDLTYMAEKLDEGIKALRGEKNESNHHGSTNGNGLVSHISYADNTDADTISGQEDEVPVMPEVVSHSNVTRNGDTVRVETRTAFNYCSDPAVVAHPAGISSYTFYMSDDDGAEMYDAYGVPFERQYEALIREHEAFTKKMHREHEADYRELERKLDKYEREYEERVKEYDRALKKAEKEYNRKLKKKNLTDAEREAIDREYLEACMENQNNHVRAQTMFIEANEAEQNAVMERQLVREKTLAEIESSLSELQINMKDIRTAADMAREHSRVATQKAREQAQRERQKAQAEAQKAREQAQRERQKALAEAQKAREQAQRERQKAQVEAQKAREQAQRERQKAIEQAQRERQKALAEAQKAREQAQREGQKAVEQAQRERQKAIEQAQRERQKALAEAQKAREQAQREGQKAIEQAQRERQKAIEQAQRERQKALAEAQQAREKAQQAREKAQRERQKNKKKRDNKSI